MQTFLPYPNITKTAVILDYKRLGKQRVEAWQIYKSLTQPTYGWKHHPAVKMWIGYEKLLLEYGLAMCTEWKRRGFVDNMTQLFLGELQNFQIHSQIIKYPDWFNDKKFYVSHRSNLLRKNPQYYRHYWPKLTDKLPYYWPTNNNVSEYIHNK